MVNALQNKSAHFRFASWLITTQKPPCILAPSKMDVLQKTFLQIILAAKWLVRHSRTYPQPAATTFCLPFCSYPSSMFCGYFFLTYNFFSLKMHRNINLQNIFLCDSCPKELNLFEIYMSLSHFPSFSVSLPLFLCMPSISVSVPLLMSQFPLFSV